MRKTHWVSLAIAVFIAGCFGFLEQRRSHYFLEARPVALPPGADAQAFKAAGENEDRSLDKKLAFLMQRAELAAYDARFKLRGDRPASSEIAIIAVDEASLTALH